jgi:hypothetical protein
LVSAGRYAVASESVPFAGTSATTEFDAVLASASACPLRFSARSRWSLRPCLEVEVGRLSVAGSGPTLVEALEQRALWLSTGLSLRGDVVFWGPLHLSTSVGGSVPLARNEFFYAPDLLAFQVPALSWQATGSLAVTF